MATQPNQINDIVEPVQGFPATDYQIKTMANYPIQTLADYKNIYSKLNLNSISDYLTSKGQDPSIANRTLLGQKYGISNVGTAEGNTALLNAIKKGAPVENVSTPITGSLTTTVADGSGRPIVPEVKNGTGNGMVTGSITGATGTDTTQTDPNQPPVNPDIATTKTAFTQTQQAVIDVTKRIDDINKSIDSALANKRKEIEQSGGVVDESQLRSTVLAESAPLLAERKDLLSNRTQLVGEQNIAGKTYQDAINAQKESDANFYKSATLGLNQTKVANQAQQFAQKFEQAGYKPQKTNITDSAGNILGQAITTWVNPANKNLGVTEDGTNVALSTKNGETTATPIGNNSLPMLDKKDTPPKGVTIAAGYTPTQVYQSLISGPNKSVKGIVGGVDQETLYNAAIDLIMGVASTQGARIPAAAAFSVQQKKTEIMNAYGLNEGDINITKTQFKNLSATNATILQRTSLTNIAANAASDNLDLAIKASANVPRGSVKILNKFSQWLSGNYTPNGPLAAFETAIYSFGREYAKVISGSAASVAGLTDSAQNEVDKLLNAAQSPEVFASVSDIMKKDMQNVIAENEKAVNNFPSAVIKLYGFTGGQGGAGGGATTLSRGNMSAKDFVGKAVEAHGMTYDQAVTKYNALLQPGEQAAVDNATGDIVAASPEDIKSGNFTPL